MLDPRVQEIFSGFVEGLEVITERHAVYTLDGSWPSVSLLGLFTFGMLGKEKFSTPEEVLLKGASAYLAKFVHDCWESCGIKVSVDLGVDGIEIRASSGTGIPEGQEVVAKIEKTLLRLLKDPPENFPVFRDFERKTFGTENIFSLYGIGLLTGLSPFIDGPWSEVTSESMSEHIERVQKYVATQCAERYARFHPEDTLGQVAELYLNRLIYPPILMSEKLPAFTSVEGLLEFQKEYQVSNKNMLIFAERLATSPDELISTVGFCYYAAVVEDNPAARVVAVGERLGSYAGLLRASVGKVRGALELREEWIYQEEFDVVDIKRFELEKELGLMPWINLPPARRYDGRLAPIFHALTCFDLFGSLELVDVVLGQDPSDIGMRLQRIQLEMITDDPEDVQSSIQSLVSEPGAEKEALLYSLWALNRLAAEEVKEASNFARKAYQLLTSGDRNHLEISNNYGWTLFLNNNYEKALDIFERTLIVSPDSVTTLLNKLYCLKALETEEGLQDLEEKLLKLSPLDPRVFLSVFS